MLSAEAMEADLADLATNEAAMADAEERQQHDGGAVYGWAAPNLAAAA